ncbi:MAG: hypothetical protein KC464_18255, partial [Myxococcales bacterium]|nr:hypothetical protein [Myxococcales bacterium]
MTYRPVLLLALASPLLAAPTCGGDDVGDDAPTVDFALEAPAATVELVPDGTIDLAWTLTGADHADLIVDLVSVGAGTHTYTILDRAIGAGADGVAWDGHDVDGALVVPDVYDVIVQVTVDGVLVDTAHRNLTVHGIVWTTPAPGDEVTVAAADLVYDFHFITVSQRVIGLITSLDPDVTVDGDEIPFDTRSIPGEFVPFSRDLHFEGVDLDGVAVPAGDYTLVVDVTDADTDLA